MALGDRILGEVSLPIHQRDKDVVILKDDIPSLRNAFTDRPLVEFATPPLRASSRVLSVREG